MSVSQFAKFRVLLAWNEYFYVYLWNILNAKLHCIVSYFIFLISILLLFGK